MKRIALETCGRRFLCADELPLQDAPREHKESGGKQWDTVKPLSKFFARMHRICLVDDDEFKVASGAVLSWLAFLACAADACSRH